MNDEKPKTKEEIDIHPLTFQPIVVTEEKILSSWKAIEDKINSLEAEELKKKVKTKSVFVPSISLHSLPEPLRT